MGAVTRSCRSAATSVTVCHDPNGTLHISRSPRGERPPRRVIPVEIAVSIDEYQPLRVELTLSAPPAPSHGGHVRTILFGRVQDFF